MHIRVASQTIIVACGDEELLNDDELLRTMTEKLSVSKPSDKKVVLRCIYIKNNV